MNNEIAYMILLIRSFQYFLVWNDALYLIARYVNSAVQDFWRIVH